MRICNLILLQTLVLNNLGFKRLRDEVDKYSMISFSRFKVYHIGMEK